MITTVSNFELGCTLFGEVVFEATPGSPPSWDGPGDPDVIKVVGATVLVGPNHEEVKATLYQLEELEGAASFMDAAVEAAYQADQEEMEWGVEYLPLRGWM